MTSRQIAFALACAFGLLLAPARAAASEPRLLDDTLSLGLPGESPDGLTLGLGRPSSTPELAVLGCMMSMIVPGLGQMLLGRPAIGGLILVAEALMFLAGVVLIDAGSISYLFILGAAVVHVVQMIHAFVLGDQRGAGSDDGLASVPPPAPIADLRPLADARR